MQKRKLILGEYDTSVDGWTLRACAISKAAQIQSFVSVPGRYAALDLSTHLTDGQPYYDSCTLSATLENSTGNYTRRKNLINAVVNGLDGRMMKIVHPDHSDQYLIGRVQVYPQYSDLSHCAIDITAVCDPWFYAVDETTVSVAATSTEQVAKLTVTGRMAVLPKIVTTGEVILKYGGSSWSLNAGEHYIPELLLAPSAEVAGRAVYKVTYSGEGAITFTYREAVLAV